MLAACAGAGPPELESDWQRAQESRSWHEIQVTLPPYPRAVNLLEFDAGAGTDFHFFVDAASLSVGSDGVVRYALVARSAGGVDNVAYEGLRCKDGDYKVYATGRGDGTWAPARGVHWRPVEQRAGSWHRALAESYFCPRKSPIGSAGEGVDALKRGGNPKARRSLQDLSGD